MAMGSKKEGATLPEGESYDHLLNEEYSKDELEPGVESHPDGGNQIFRGICSQTSLV